MSVEWKCPMDKVVLMAMSALWYCPHCGKHYRIRQIKDEKTGKPMQILEVVR
ncbi:MAG: hypothetical protein HYS44_01805 [Candidatus Niyogibacteria bacterium]|nr:hypothetical protein [Candidatus Niyogibacteria bacterium]